MRYWKGNDGGDGSVNVSNKVGDKKSGVRPQESQTLVVGIVGYYNGAGPLSSDNQAKNTSGTNYVGLEPPTVCVRRGR